MKLKNNVFIGMYIVMTFGFIFINENIYKNILRSYENIGFILIFVSILYSLFLNSRYKKVYIAFNIIILILVIAVITLSIPKYTYLEAQKIIGHDKIGKGNIIEVYNKEYKGRIGIEHLKIRPGRNIMINGDYLVYFYSTTDGKIEWYRFNAIEGTYKLYDAK